MAYCYERGLPHSEFLTWPAEDRAKILAHRIEQSLRCDMCGTADWEWDPKQGGSRHAYDHQEKFCQGCYIKSAAAEDKKTLPGTSIVLVKLSSRQKAQQWVAQKRRAKRDRADRLRQED